MPEIPTIRPYVSSHVSHALPKLSPEVNIHAADAIFEANIRGWAQMDKTVHDAMDSVNEFFMKTGQDMQDDNDMSGYSDYKVMQAKHAAGLNERISQTADPKAWGGIIEQSYKDHFAESDKWAKERGLSKRVRQRIAESSAGDYAQAIVSYGGQAAVQIKRQAVESIHANFETITNSDANLDYKVASFADMKEGLLDAGYNPAEADKMEKHYVNQANFWEESKRIAEDPMNYVGYKENKVVDKQQQIQLGRIAEIERSKAERELDEVRVEEWQQFNARLNDKEYFTSPEEIKTRFTHLKESDVRTAYRTSEAQRKADSREEVKAQFQARSDEELQRFFVTRKEVLDTDSDDLSQFIGAMERAEFMPPAYRRVIMDDISDKTSRKKPKRPPEIATALSKLRGDLNAFWREQSSTPLNNKFAMEEDVEVTRGWFTGKPKKITVKQDIDTQARLIQRYIDFDNQILGIADQPGMTPDRLAKEYYRIMGPLKAQTIQERIMSGME